MYSIKSISIAKGVTADLLKENDFAESYPKNEATFKYKIINDGFLFNSLVLL